MSLPSLTLNQGENVMSGANNYLKDYSSNPSMALGSRAFGKELTNYGRAEPEYLKDYNLRSKNYKTNNTGIGIKTSMPIEPNNKMKIESIDGKDQQRDLLSKDENGKNYLKTLLAGDSQIEEIDDVDLTVMDNPQYVCEYVNEVMAYLQDTEEKYAPKAGLMVKIQTDINEKMRAILVDWLIDVHLKFKLLPETFYLTINIIDRFLSAVPILRAKLQLVGVAAMLIASKYEEIYPPEVKDFEYVTDRAYNREEILDMEGKILSCMNFNITTPSSYRFLERYARVAGFDERSFNLAQYLLELATVEYQMLKYLPSNLACSAIYLVNKIQQKKDSWTDQLIRHTKYKETQLRPCAKDLCILLQKAAKSNLQAARRKFSSTKFLEVAKITLDKLS